MTKKATMTKYTDAEGHFVSLVGKGANQLPIKIIKQDKGDTQMKNFNLSNLFKSITKGSKEPVTVVAIATDKDPAILSGLLDDEGITPLKITKSEKNGNTIILEEVESNEDVHAVKLSDSLTVVVKGFTPWADDLVGNASFAEFVQTQSFFSSVYDASDALSSALRVTMYDADDKEDAKTKIAGILDQYKDYVLGIIDGLPTMAFKMEKALGEEQAETVVKTEGVEEGNTPAVDPAPEPEKTEPETKTDPEPETKVEGDQGGTQSVAQPEPTDPENTDTNTGGDAPTGTAGQEDLAVLIAKSIAEALPSALAGVLQPLNDRLDGLVQEGEQKDSVITALKQEVQKADKAASTALRTSATKSDNTPEPEQAEVFKGTGCIDTAVHRPELPK